MNSRERFLAIMRYEPFDRLPVYFFGTWPETKKRWAREGLAGVKQLGGSGGPQLPEMDTDWEGCIWDNQGLLRPGPLAKEPARVVEETDTYVVRRSGLGGLHKFGKTGSSPPHMIEPDLKPTREDWQRFKAFLDPDDPARRAPDFDARADALNRRDHATCFNAGSLWGRLRDWMGVEAVCYLAYDDPALYEEIVAYLADYYIAVNRPLLERVQFEFGYVHEDCCFNGGPLISPDIYRRFHDRHYRRLIRAYRDLGVPLFLMDSDGKVDDLIDLWLESGFDIVFPIEVGTWRADPAALRRRFGKRLRMMGGVNKLVIPRGAAAVRAELEPLRPLVEEGGYIPLPDHRIPPDCSLDQFRTYLRVFRDVFHQ